MKTVNSLSGGKSSSLMAKKCKADYNVFSLVCIDDYECKIKDSFVNNYVNNKLSRFIPLFGEFIASAEDSQTVRAMIDLEQYIGQEIIWVRGMSFDNVIDTGTQNRLPSWARRYCTEKMKLLPIFLWWFHEIGEKCRMNIGFRFDEFNRIERFFNNSNPNNFCIPISCNTYGNKRQNFKTYNWRECHFPLAKEGINKSFVNSYWDNNGIIPADLFNEQKKIEFPAISNCVGCFHKQIETLAASSIINPPIMNWFAKQELKDMGTWLDSRITYQHIIDNKFELSKEVYYEMKVLKRSCDSGGCTD